MSIKERMANFIECLANSDSTRVNISSRTHTATNFFRAAVPALLTGLAVAMSAPAQGEDLASELRTAVAETMYEVLINGVDAEPMLGMSAIAKNQEEALQKYAPTQGDINHLYACERVFGDTFNQEAQDLVEKQGKLTESKQQNKEFIPTDETLEEARREAFLKIYCVYGDKVNEDVYKKLTTNTKTQQVSQTYTEQGADVSELVLEAGYQQLMTQDNVDYFNQRVINDSGDTVRGPQSSVEALSQHVNSRNAAGWAGAVFGIAEGLARMNGSPETASKARAGRDMANKADRYYGRGKRASRQSGGRSAEAFGNIFRDVGREIERHRGRYGS